MSKEFDIIIWGATGFTGRLVAEYFAQRYPGQKEFKWAIAGRNQVKLEDLRENLSHIDSSLKSLDIFIGDSLDLNSLKKIASKSKVICTTVGPYYEYGQKMVEACVEESSDYCDLTGEVPFIREMIDLFHHKAQKKKLKIVHCCGFDSIPSDLGCLTLQSKALKQFGKPCNKVTLYSGKTKGGLSGGTIASLLGVVDSAKKNKAVRKILFDAYSLNPEGEKPGIDKRDPSSVKFDTSINGWTAPFLMGPINTRVVRRSNALTGFSYGRDFSYTELMSFPPSFKGRLMAESIRSGLGAFLVASSISLSRKILEKTMLPAPGEGPSREDRESGFFNIKILGLGTDEAGKEFKLEVKVKGDRDPGYGATAKMLGESAIALATSKSLPKSFGVITPAIAFDLEINKALAEAGIRID